MIDEVRRQFKEIPGIMEGTGRPEYEKCVDISTAAALKEMIIPGLLAVLSPVAVGFALGAEALGGLLGGSVVAGVMLAVFMSDSGGAWDSAKECIEGGNFSSSSSPWWLSSSRPCSCKGKRRVQYWGEGKPSPRIFLCGEEDQGCSSPMTSGASKKDSISWK